MPVYGSSTGDEFAAGIDHVANTGRANDFSHTLGDQGLDQTSAQWNNLTPRGVLSTAMGASGQDDGSFEDYQREQSTYAPGSMETFQDQLSRGSDTIS